MVNNNIHRYNLGGVDLKALTGEALVTALKQQEEGRTIARGAQGVLDTKAGPAGAAGVLPVAAEVRGRDLRQALTFPETWGPTEWGPIPYLPSPDILVRVNLLTMRRMQGRCCSPTSMHA